MTTEMMVGTRWLNWAGAVMLIIGMALLMKFAYDNSIIGPKQRLVGGIIAGVAALLFSERSLRRGLTVVFQATAGVGYAILFTCIYFATQVHNFIPSSIGLVLALGVVVMAVVSAVARNAQPIAILAVVGGFLSPVLLMEPEYRPHAFFLYLTIINLTALAASWKRSWPPLEVLSFVGTVVVYLTWYSHFGKPPLENDRLLHTLGYLSLLCGLYLVIPLLNQLVRREGESRLSIQIVVASCIFFISMAHYTLYMWHPHWLGWIALAQAGLVAVMFGVWVARRGMETNTAKALLVIAIALATYSVPLHLDLYAIPIVWALEGLLLLSVGLIFTSRTMRVMGLLALCLAGGGLVYRLPMHVKAFRPVINIAFTSWMVVGLSAVAGATVLQRKRQLLHKDESGLIELTAALAFAILGHAFTAEIMAYWKILRIEVAHVQTPMFSSVILMWSLIVMISAVALRRNSRLGGNLVLLPLAAGVVALFFNFIIAFGYSEQHWATQRFILNWISLPRLAFPAALFFLSWLMKGSGTPRNLRQTVESVGHIALVLLLAAELIRWSDVWVGGGGGWRLGVGVVSAVWAIYAAGLIWAGIVTRSPLRRWLGFALFGVTIAKVLLVDTARLETAYRIVSFLGTGAFLMVAGFLYNRFAVTIEAEGTDPENEEAKA